VTEVTGGGKLSEEEFHGWYSLQILLRLSIKDDEVSGACTARSVGYKCTRLYGHLSVQERIIKMALKIGENGNLVYVAQDMAPWRSV
jgi:hypothetical protein